VEKDFGFINETGRRLGLRYPTSPRLRTQLNLLRVLTLTRTHTFVNANLICHCAATGTQCAANQRTWAAAQKSADDRAASC